MTKPMSVEREKFEAWLSQKLNVIFTDHEDKERWREQPHYQMQWAAWQARADARPSVSGLPERGCEYCTSLATDHNHANGRRCCGDCCAAHGGLTGDKYAYYWIRRIINAHNEFADAQSSRIVELERELEKSTTDWDKIYKDCGKLEEMLEAKREDLEIELGYSVAQVARIIADWREGNKLRFAAESKLAVCREETIKECAEACVANIETRRLSDLFQQGYRERSVDCKNLLLSKLPSVAEEETKIP